MNDRKSRDLPGQKSVKHCHYLAALKFCETSGCALGVYLQQRKAKRREWILHYFGFLRETSLSSSQCQNEHGEEKCQCFNEVAEAKRTYSGENVLSCSWHTELDSQTASKRISCGVFFSFFFLFVWFPVRLALSVDSQLSSPHGQNLNQAANRNSILLEYCSHHEHFNDALFICTFSVYSFISSPERFLFGSVLYISHVNRLCLYSETIACVRHLCKRQNCRWRGQIFSDPFHCGRTSCRLVGWCNKMILFAGWQLPHDAQMCSVCFTASLPRHSIQEPQEWGP